MVCITIQPISAGSCTGTPGTFLNSTTLALEAVLVCGLAYNKSNECNLHTPIHQQTGDSMHGFS